MTTEGKNGIQRVELHARFCFEVDDDTKVLARNAAYLRQENILTNIFQRRTTSRFAPRQAKQIPPSTCPYTGMVPRPLHRPHSIVCGSSAAIVGRGEVVVWLIGNAFVRIVATKVLPLNAAYLHPIISF